MIKIQTKLKIVDNCGAKWAKCIRIIGKGKGNSGFVGDLLLVTLSKFFNRKKVKKRSLYIGLIVGIRYWTKRMNGIFIKFFSNRILIFNKQYKFLGTRVYGGVLKEIKLDKKDGIQKYYQKIISYTSLII